MARRSRWWLLAGAFFLAMAAPLLVLIGCFNHPPLEMPYADGDSEPGGEYFVDVTAGSGLNHTYRNGQEAGVFAILEFAGGGVALIDYDKDGLLDIFVTGGGYFVKTANGKIQIKGYPCRLFKNLGNWKFKDVTAEVGLDKLANGQPWFYTHGAAVADYDNDGWPDLLVTGWGRLALFHNEPDGKGGRRFVDVTEKAGLHDRLWSTSAAWGDLDGDGYPDLYVCHYVDWSLEKKNPVCNYSGHRDVCFPSKFNSLPHVLYHNNRNGTFTDVSQEAGILESHALENGKGLGVMMADIEGKGRLDVYVANDETDNLLYLNRSDRKQRLIKLEEVGVTRGVARDDNGTMNGSMGIAGAYYDGSGNFSIIVTNFQNEAHALYRNLGTAQFVFASRRAGIAAIGPLYIGWGVGFIDYDRDGAEDIFIVNGHVMHDPPPPGSLRQDAVLFHNLLQPGQKPQDVGFKCVNKIAGQFFQTKHRARGAAFGDLDNDGRTDVVISCINEPVILLRNNLDNGHHWLGIDLVGQPYRDAVGAKLTLEVGSQKLVRQVLGGGSYLSANDRRIIFGLGDQQKVGRLTVQWPSGEKRTQTFDGLAVDRYWRLVQGDEQPRAEKSRNAKAVGGLSSPAG